MASVKLKSEKLKNLEKQEERQLKEIARLVAAAEKVNAERKEDLEKKKSIKKQKYSGKEYDAQELKILNNDIKRNTAKLEVIRTSIKSEKRRNRNLKRNISIVRKNLAKLEARLNKPKIIDLNLDFKPMAIQGSVNKVIGHYTAGPKDKDTKDAIRLCKIYHQAHLNQGWSGEAYMLCFTSDGNILLLRPSKYVGAHTLGYNTGSYGIMMHGTTGDKPTNAQLRALRWWGKNGHKAIMGKCATVIQPNKLPWYGHNDFNPTSCPGEFKQAYKSQGKSK